MWRTTIAGLRAHARRMFGTALAVILGVGFVAGTLIFADTARAGFFDTYSRTARNLDAAVEPLSSGKGVASLTPVQVGTVKALPDVQAVDARMVQPLALLDRRGRVITNFGVAGLAVSTDGDPGLRAFDVTGRVPTAEGEAVLDKETAAHQRFSIGDTVTVLDRAGNPHPYRVVGLIDFGTSKRFAGESVVGLPALDITALTGASGYDEIAVQGRAGVSQTDLQARIQAVLGGGAGVVTGDQRRLDLANAATNVANQFQVVLLVFGVISLIVAAFVIYNTFAILLAQRIRETALLRCVGATRRQVFGSVLLESVLVGLFGGAAGVLLGIGVSYGLLGLLNGVLGAGVPVHTVVVGGVPVVAGLAIGLVVTTCSAFIPAVRATRTRPLQALRDVPSARNASLAGRIVRLVLAAIFGMAGIALTIQGYGEADFRNGTFMIVAGGVVTFLAVLVLTPLFIGRLTAVIGAVPGRLFGPPARLATANARRNPGRTAVTTATLMIGVGLIALFSVLIASVKATATAQLVGHYPVDYVMTGVQYGDRQPIAPIPADYVAAVRARTEFSSVVEVRSLQSGNRTYAAIDPAGLRAVGAPTMTRGRFSDLTAGTVIVVASRPLDGASTVTIDANGKSEIFRVVGATSSAVPGVRGVDALLTWDDLGALAGPGGDAAVLTKDAPGVTPVTSRDALDSLADRYPQVEVSSLADLSSDLDSTVNGLIALFGGLLGTAILIALFGIANTLSLSVVERTPESATVRALGLTRGQLRVTLLIEALLMGVVGALVGIAYGLVYGRLVVAEAFKQVHPILVVPWSWLAGLMVLAALAGMVAAVMPARRAARTSIVAAMADM
jgi:putative ABC transport system permease protein